MNIQNSTMSDVDTIFELYRLATNHQKIHFPKVSWPVFERSLVTTEIEEKRQWKLLVDDTVGCVWATTFSDPQIWEEKNSDPAVYIHRIATNPDLRGQNFVSKIVEWATAYAKLHDKKYIRMDTCGNNLKLIAYYQKCGFDFLGIHKLKKSDGLPAHYIGADVCFFEMKL